LKKSLLDSLNCASKSAAGITLKPEMPLVTVGTEGRVLSRSQRISQIRNQLTYATAAMQAPVGPIPEHRSLLVAVESS